MVGREGPEVGLESVEKENVDVLCFSDRRE